MAMFGRVLCGEKPGSSEAIEKGTQLCLKSLPAWDDAAGTIDMIYWHFGTLAIFQVGGKPWMKWDTAYREAVLPKQRSAGPDRGSWDPIGVWGRYGGRVYSTAITVLTLQTWRRYPTLRRR